jgi:hypothetical protein
MTNNQISFKGQIITLDSTHQQQYVLGEASSKSEITGGRQAKVCDECGRRGVPVLYSIFKDSRNVCRDCRMKLLQEDY